MTRDRKEYIHSRLKFKTLKQRAEKVLNESGHRVRIDQYDNMYMYSKQHNAYMFFANITDKDSFVDMINELIYGE